MLVLDANILIRAVLGRQARALLARYGESVEFVAPDIAFGEAERHLPQLLERRNLQPEPFMAYLLARRDENDWPILATALALRCPIWTEDTDFFGCGVATWTTDRVELYLSEVAF